MFKGVKNLFIFKPLGLNKLGKHDTYSFSKRTQY
jgi:hypothetical protein